MSGPKMGRVTNVAVRTLNQGDNHDNTADTNDHAEQSQSRAQPMRPDSGKGEFECLDQPEKLLETNYVVPV